MPEARAQKRKKIHTKKSRAVKISKAVYAFITKHGGRDRSVDATLRNLLGLPDRKGRKPKLKTYWILKKPSVRIFTELKVAKGEALRIAIRKGWELEEKPKKVKEIG